MIVYLTRTQYMAIVQSLPDDIYVWVETGRLEGNRMRWQEIPDFWLWLVERHVADLDHGSLKSVAFRNAIQVIVKETNRYRAHPAWSGHGVIGEQPEVLVGWRTPDEHLEPFFRDAVPDYEQRVLAPVYSTVGGQRVTTWAPTWRRTWELPEMLRQERFEEFWRLTHQDAALQQGT